MFGHVDFVVQAAPGRGIVSSAVLQSDCLDEIDWEWIGDDDEQVQSNYFGKGITTTYNRGAFHGDPGNHSGFKTYSIDWTADQIVWSINGSPVRTLSYSEAAAGQYPQTPMMIKTGAWSGGDSSNPAGTVAWAGGQTDYSQGPFTMYLKSIHAKDYSTGSQYTYSGAAGTWQSIKSTGGTINSSGSDSEGTDVAPVTSANPTTQPRPFAGTDTSTVYTIPTVYPYAPTTYSSPTATASLVTSISGLPSGWTVNTSGKVVPPSSAAMAIIPTSIGSFCVAACLALLFRT